MNITMIGTGYVGLTTGACFAELGHRVVCLDFDTEKIGRLREGHVPIFEPGLQELVDRNTATGRLSFSADYVEAVPGADVVFVAVGTPSSATGKADLSYVKAAVDDLAKVIENGVVVVVKSTVPVGTTAEMAARIRDARPDLEVSVGSNPEFLRQGSAVADFLGPDRIVIGGENATAAESLREIYQPLLTRGVPALVTNLETAELIKYASNSFLATKLSFINEIADLCELSGASVEDVAEGMGLDSRIGPKFLQAGPGYGGSCFPKDTQALLHTSQVFGAPSRIVAAAVDVNTTRRRRMADKIAAAAGGSLAGAKVAVLGLAFKANTDDLRESPAVEIIRSLVGLGAEVHAYDPEAMDNARRLLAGITYTAGVYETIEGADLLVILTEWPEFATLDLPRVAGLLTRPVIVDTRNLYDPQTVTAAGLEYHSIGRRVGLPD
jgi:UDPglucose 6-dehydrogenase